MKHNVSELIRIEIPIEPTGQMRPRTTARGKYARIYKAKKQMTREAQIIPYLIEQRPKDAPWEGPIAMNFTANMIIPKSYSKTKRRDCISGEYCHTKKPDLSNMVKQIEDCANGILWLDDSQICSRTENKRYSEKPGWVIEIWRV